MDNRSALFENYTYKEYMAVTGPKVDGAGNLHNTLINNDLDVFVSIASITGLIGNHWQSATIDLGGLTEVGYLAVRAPELQDQMRKVMGAEISEKELLAILDAAISGHVGKDSNYSTVTGLQCTGSEAESFWSHAPLFSHLHVKKSMRQKDAWSGMAAFSARKGSADADSLAAAKKVIYDCLAAKFSTVLMIDEEDLSSDKALGAYGTDSSIAVELRNWIGREMGSHGHSDGSVGG